MAVSVGSPFVVTILVAPCTENELLADGQFTEPSTAGLVVAFHVLVALSIQSPVCAAPPRRKFVVHESTLPTRGSVAAARHQQYHDENRHHDRPNRVGSTARTGCETHRIVLARDEHHRSNAVARPIPAEDHCDHRHV